MLDVLILGAGVTGCSIARELSRYDLNVLVVDKHSDVCEGTSKANSGIVHAGYDAKPGTLKAKLNVEGNSLIKELSEELDFPFRENGSLVLCFDEKDRDVINKLYDQGVTNGVKGLQIIEKDKIKELEPNVTDEAVCALYAPSAGVVCPFLLTIAMAENASVNGVNFSLKTECDLIEKTESGYRVRTNKGTFETKTVVNAAGVSSDVFHNMVSDKKIKIIPRKGEYLLMDRTVGGTVSHTIFQLPTKLGKGVLVTQTVHGNLLVGPNANDIEDGEEVSTTADGLSEVAAKAALSIPGLPGRQTITSFAGVRAHEENGDFILGECEDAPGFYDAAGIESPGLTCAPAIGVMLAGMIADKLNADLKNDFINTRKGIPNPKEMTREEYEALIKENPLYANVICRCETITEGEIVDSIRRPLGASTLDGVKRRTRAGMGRCQAGFCSPKVAEILAREMGTDIGDIRKNDPGSEILKGYIKEDL